MTKLWMRAVWVSAWWLASSLAGPAEAQLGPGRIAVGGTYPSGYVGVLARYGLTRDTLSDDALGNPAAAGSYDLLVVAGSPFDGPALDPVVKAVLSHGGGVLIDYGPPPGLGNVRQGAGFDARRMGNYLVTARSTSKFRLKPGQTLLHDALGEVTEFEACRAEFAPKVEPGDTVLAEFTATVDPKEVAANQNKRRRIPDSGPAAPAVIYREVGPGRLILCGPGIGIDTQLMGTDYDHLILGMIRLLSNGRAVAQLEPDVQRLGRKESARSLGETQPATPEVVTAVVAEPTKLPVGPGQPSALPQGYEEYEPEPGQQYNVDGGLDGGAEVLLMYWNAENYTQVTFEPTGIAISRVAAGKRAELARTDVKLAAGTHVVVKQRGLRIIAGGGGALAQAELKSPHRGVVAGRGLDDGGYQSVEPVYFTDDFMRTSDKSGGWETIGGNWETAPVENPDMGANPFSYKVRASGQAVALQGYNFWDEYRFVTAVRAGAGNGRVGTGIYAQDPKNLILFTGRVLTKPGPQTNGFQLTRVVDGRPTVLAQCDGGFVSGQWYRVELKADGPWLGVYVDGVKLCGAKDTTFPGGKLALFAEDADGRFDDALAEPAHVSDGVTAQLGGRVPDYAGLIDLDSWAGPATPWDPEPDIAGLFWRRNTFFGDVTVQWDLDQLPKGGEVTLVLDGDGQRVGSGYALVVKRTGSTADIELRNWGAVRDRAKVELGDGVNLLAKRDGDQIEGYVDGRKVVSAGVIGAGGGGRLAFKVGGFKPKVGGLSVFSRNLRDETFDSAPTEWWVDSGVWDVTNRWSCTPDWSWFGGWSAKIAAIWYKHPLLGDQVLDFYVGPKMLKKELGTSERVGDFNAVLCGDGVSVDSGYSFIVGGEDGTGAAVKRNGLTVAQNKDFRLFRQGHNRWANVRCEKMGQQVRLLVDGQLVLAFTDAPPLAGGYPALWTQHNGIMLPRITLSYQKLGDQPISLAGPNA